MTGDIIKLEGCYNFRDLGGLPCGNGGFTRKGKFYRADSLYGLTKGDIDTVRSLVIRCVIDLRFENETGSKPNPLRGREGFDYYNISLLDGVYSNDYKNAFPESMADMYVGMVEEAKGQMTDIFRTIYKHRNDGIVFHCTAGKDRTGVVAALLLSLAGVRPQIIIDNYAVTYELIKEVTDKQMEKARLAGFTIPISAMLSEPENMEIFLAHIKNNYGSAYEYMEQLGLSREEIDGLISALVI